MSYWDETGKYQKEYEALWQSMVPMEGSTQTVEAENMRAITKITHDYYNNGFGNNWTGAFNWLQKNKMIISPEFNILAPYANCNYARYIKDQYSETDEIAITLNSIMDRVLEDIFYKQNNSSLTPNTDDMLNYDEPDDYSCDDEDYGYY